jgi:predicted metal-dependent peptidase
MNEVRFKNLLQELIDENPFAIRAMLKVLEVIFTTRIPTLAVTCEDRPQLLVNLEFVSQHCKTDNHVKAIVCHEFLHVLLRHTEQTTKLTTARHIALDGIINAIIHRQYGAEYSGMMAEYYKGAKGLQKLLRPMNASEEGWFKAQGNPPNRLPQWVMAWSGLYMGKLVADDIEGLAESLSKPPSPGDKQDPNLGPFILEEGLPNDLDDLIGNHSELGEPLPDALVDVLNQTLKEMNGKGIWRAPKQRGIGANPYEALFNAKNDPMSKWQQKTLAVLRQHLMPDRQSKAVRMATHEYRIPVLSPKDRRAFLRTLWDSFLPEAAWDSQMPKREGSANVYLDVSGSMSAEMPQIIALLGRLSKYIKRPFWAFSDVVAPAIIERGQLKTDTTGGTSMQCVLEHVAKTRPQAAIVVTDGYIERIDKRLVTKLAATKLHVLLTRDGSPVEIRRIGLPYTQLDKVPS